MVHEDDDYNDEEHARVIKDTLARTTIVKAAREKILQNMAMSSNFEDTGTSMRVVQSLNH